MGFSTEIVETEGRSLDSVECMQLDWWGRLCSLQHRRNCARSLHVMLYRHITGAIQWLPGRASYRNIGHASQIGVPAVISCIEDARGESIPRMAGQRRETLKCFRRTLSIASDGMAKRAFASNALKAGQGSYVRTEHAHDSFGRPWVKRLHSNRAH